MPCRSSKPTACSFPARSGPDDPGVDVLVDTQVRDYSLTGDSADIPDPLLFLAKPDSILVTKTMADREGFTIDQKIQVQTVEGIRTFHIRGILNPEGPAKAMGGNLAVMDIYAAQMAFGKEGRIDRIDVSLRRGENLEAVRQAVMAAASEGLCGGHPGRQDTTSREHDLPVSERFRSHQLSGDICRHVPHL